MKRLAYLLLLTGCVHGTPFDPEDVCYDVTIVVTLSEGSDSLPARPDSIIYEDCGR